MTFENLTKTFGAVPAVQEFTLKVKDQSFLVLLGPSGCGKTTLLRLLAGFEEPDEGSLFIDSRRVNDLSPRDRDIAMVFQSYALYPHMTVFENIAFGLRMRRTPKPEIAKRVREAAALLDMEDYLDRKPSALSGGQRQRVALARCLVRNPKVFLMDEPLSNLDATLRARTRSELLRIHQKVPTTTIYVTHDQVEAMSLATEIALLSRGKLSQMGSPLSLYKNPANTFVAGFLGSPPMNLSCGLKKRTTFTTKNGAHFDLSREPPFPDGEVILGFRPENISLSPLPREALSFSASLLTVEHLGSEVLLTLGSAEESFKALVKEPFHEAPGARFRLALPEGDLYWFQASGQRIPTPDLLPTP